MDKYIVLLLLICCRYTQSGIIHRTTKEIEEFDQFLKKSVYGEVEEVLNPELGLLQNEWERSGKFEGDIILSDEQRKILVDDYAGIKNGQIAANRHWPNKVLIYSINATAFNATQRKSITDAMAEIAKVSCITFKERTNEINYVNIQGSPGGCSSTVGYNGGPQQMNLTPSPTGPGCLMRGTILHEILHSLGFFHMQSTNDRDDWVGIVWEKIKPGYEGNFNKYDSTIVSQFGEKYDYGSVLQYSQYAFSTDGNKTIVPLKPTNGVTIGQRTGMSASDIIKLNKSYNCPGF